MKTLNMKAFLTVTLAISFMMNGCASSEPSASLPVQRIYVFDDNRYLELEGHGCEGAIYYVDVQRGIRTAYIEQYARVFLPDITHADADGDFIFIPYSDVSGFAVSKDHGKTFQEGKWVGSREFGVDQIKKLTVINQQAFIELKDGRLFMTSKPFGQGWGLGVIDVENHLPTTVFKHRPEFQGLPTKVPEVKNYKGWTQMRCDPNL